MGRIELPTLGFSIRVSKMDRKRAASLQPL
jgi:hypothetical protein